MAAKRKAVEPTADTPPSSVLLNGLRILETFTAEQPLLGVTEIARRVGQHKSTVSRILSSLESAEYVSRDDDSGRFRLGLGLMRLAGPLLADLDVRRACHPALDELVDITGETAALMIWNGHESVVVEQVPSPQQVKHTSAIGTRYDTLESSSVRVFLAWTEPDTARAAVGRLSSTDRAELAQVRADDVAVNDGQTSAQEVGVAAPVRDYRGVVVAAVLLAAPRFRMPAELIEKRTKHVRDAAETVSRRLGGNQTHSREAPS